MNEAAQIVAHQGETLKLTPRQFLRFWQRVRREKDCWVWTGCKNKEGYGYVAFNRGVIKKTHRVSWMVMHGAIPPGIVVMHKCDNPPCVNPAHLMLGTHSDNSQDRENKGRGFCGKGENNPSAKLTNKQAAEIRERWNMEGPCGKITKAALGREYRVSRRAIEFIIQRRTYNS